MRTLVIKLRKVVEKAGGIKEERYYLGNYEVYRKFVGVTLETERTTAALTDDKRKIATIDKLTVDERSLINLPVAVIRYQYDNHLGSASLELDATAQIISYEEYHPFGTTSYRSGRSETEVSLKRYKYVGKERDEETGLYYYGFRYYAAWIARFINVDPLQHKYPQLTPFQYASNNPITLIDLDGLEGVSREINYMPEAEPYRKRNPKTSNINENRNVTKSANSSNLDFIPARAVQGASYLFFSRGVLSMLAGDKEGYNKYMQSGLLLSNFATGKGTEYTYFTESDDAIARELNRNDRIVNFALLEFNKKLTIEDLSIEEYFNRSTVFVGEYKFSPDHLGLTKDGIIRSFELHLEAVKNPVDIVIGGMNYYIMPIRNLHSDKKELIGLSITFENPMTKYSLLLHKTENINDRDGGEGSPLSSIYQYFNYRVFFRTNQDVNTKSLNNEN